MRTLLLAIVLLAPAALAGPADSAVHAFVDGGSILADVKYADGVGSTKFSFMQLAGQSGGPAQRLEAGATCTEWRGTFTQVLVMAGSDANVASATVALVGAAASSGPTTRTTGGFTLDAMGGPGAMEGSLLVCDEPGGLGVVRLVVNVVRMPLVRADPVLVRIQEA